MLKCHNGRKRRVGFATPVTLPFAQFSLKGSSFLEIEAPFQALNRPKKSGEFSLLAQATNSSR